MDFLKIEWKGTDLDSRDYHQEACAKLKSNILSISGLNESGRVLVINQHFIISYFVYKQNSSTCMHSIT